MTPENFYRYLDDVLGPCPPGHSIDRIDNNSNILHAGETLCAVSLVEEHLYQQLFLHELNWSAPDCPPVSLTVDDGQTYIATNISSYRGIRVWVCDQRPGSKIEAALDRLIAKTTTDRLLIFYDENEQVWRWPSRSTRDNATSTRLTCHRHRNGLENTGLASRLDLIRLPYDVAVDANTVLTKLREAFDVEAHNETKRASKLMAKMYSALDTAYPATCPVKQREHEISVILARILFLMFGDDTEMWEDPSGKPVPDAFLEFIHLQTPADGSDIAIQLTALFEALDQPGGARPHGVNADLPYVNGGLFREQIELPPVGKDFRDALLEACMVDWSMISPAIFGSIYQSVRDAQTRRELGEHYTSEENILKTLNPLFLDELRSDFDRARNAKNEKTALTRLWKRIGEIRYMDPACGCGNFIIVAYRELRALELRIMERLQELSEDLQLAFDPTLSLKVTLDHFFGIEIDEWPARVAETAMFLVDRQCDLKLKERFGEAPQRLPIRTQARIVVGNALREDWSAICPPSESVILAGNPPFLGHNTRTPEQAQELRDLWRRDDIGRLDYSTGWYAKAINYFGAATRGRWAFVSTNSIVQGEPVAKLFGAIFSSGWRIRFAHRTFPWRTEATRSAAVHCVIVGFDRQEGGAPRLFDYEPNGLPLGEVDGNDPINAYLTRGANVLIEKRSTVLSKQLSPFGFGSRPNDGGNLIVEPEDYGAFAADPVARKYLRRYVGAQELLHDEHRWCLWLVDLTDSDLASSSLLRNRIEGCREQRLASRRPATREWAEWPHLFDFNSQPDQPYLCVPSVFSERRLYFLAARFDPDVIASNLTYTAVDPDGFQFAVISSTMFLTWQKTVGGRLESRPRFTNTVVWNTFPFPSVSTEIRAQIVQAGADILEARVSDKTLAQQYEPGAMGAELLAAHERLDAVVDRVFGLHDKLPAERDRQRILFSRYAELTAGEEAVSGGRRRRR